MLGLFQNQRLQHLAHSLSRKPTVLTGLWERVEDNFSGCVILVEEVDGELQGRITYVPALMRRYGWQVGDIKWRSISSFERPGFRLGFKRQVSVVIKVPSPST